MPNFLSQLSGPRLPEMKLRSITSNLDEGGDDKEFQTRMPLPSTNPPALSNIVSASNGNVAAFPYSIDTTVASPTGKDRKRSSPNSEQNK